MKLGLAAALGFEERVKQVAAPDVAHAQVVAQQALAAEAEFLDQLPRRGVLGINESLHAVQAEFVKAKVEHRRDGFGGDASPMVHRIDDIADGRPPTADVAVMIVDKAKATIGPCIGHRPEPIVGRGAVNEATHAALSLDPLGVHRMVPEAHRLGIGKAFMHRIRILGAELAQAEAAG